MLIQKLIFRLLLIIVSITSLLSITNAQTDSSKVSYSQENKDSSDYKYRRVYQYLDINMNDEKRMLKVSPGFALSNGLIQFGYQLSYEWKIKKQYSFLLSNSSSFLHYKMSSNFAGVYQEKISNLFVGTMGIEFRYYLTLKKQIENGVSGDNLNGLYSEFGFDGLLSLRNDYDYSQGYNQDRRFRFQVGNLNPKLAIGIQKRLNSWSFFNIYANAFWNKGNIHGGTGFRIGFAWGNKK